MATNSTIMKYSIAEATRFIYRTMRVAVAPIINVRATLCGIAKKETRDLFKSTMDATTTYAIKMNTDDA